MNYQKAIVRTPCERLSDALTTQHLGKPNYHQALRQHSRYVEILCQCGVQVLVLPPDNQFPDSTFVEDTAVLTPHGAIITRPGARSRRDEIEAIEPVLRQYFQAIERIVPPGTVDGGDVLRVGTHYYIGLSGRTNTAGATQLILHLENYKQTASTIPLKKLLHLKSGIAYLENAHVVVAGEMTDYPIFKHFKQIRVEEAAAYSANCLWINGKVLVADGFLQTSDAIRRAGYPVIELDVSEFRKVDGGLSCLSLRF